MILTVIVIAIVGFVGISFALSQKLRDIHIQKNVVVEGSLKDVFEQVVYLENFPNWSPFLEADPSQEVEVKGIDGQVGAQYHWVGNKGKDVGYQEIRAIVPLEYLRLECDIQKPFQARPVFEYRFVQSGEEVHVVQDFTLKSNATDAFFMWLFGAKKDMDKMNQRGLELLKNTVEKKTHREKTISVVSALNACLPYATEVTPVIQ